MLIYLNVVATVLLLSDVLHEQEASSASELDLSPLLEHCTQLQPVLDLQEPLAGWFSDSNFPPASPLFPHSPTARTRVLSPLDRYHKTYEMTVNAGDVYKAMQSSFLVSGGGISKARSSHYARKVLAGHREGIETLARHPIMQKVMASRCLRLEHLPG